MFERLKALGFQVEAVGHAEAILSMDFPAAADQLESALSATTIPIEEIIASGGGEAKGTQRLRRALTSLGWKKGIFVIQKTINGVPKESQSHEVDHVKSFRNGNTIALEIEWNNKDPFFDRDLENFKRLHAESAISVGVIVTRGRQLQMMLPRLVDRFCVDRRIGCFDDLERWGYIPTPKQKAFINGQVNRLKGPLSFKDSFTSKFVADKFGQATTHWSKLEDRIHRGVGNPCPLVFIGLPASIVTFDEGRAALAEMEALEEEAATDTE
jgi:hypothetical protein